MSRLAAIVEALRTGGQLVRAPVPLPDITGISSDTRHLTPGTLFCAVRGVAEDGHRFVAEAARRGAAAALVEREVDARLPQILVKDGRRAAALAAATFFDHPAARLQLVGVTGTSGKTTTVVLARHVLGALWPTGAIGTLGAFDAAGAPVESEAGNLTTPGPIDLQATLAALVASGARGAAMEVSSHSLDQGRVDGLVFRAGIFTNLSRDHLDYHQTLAAYLAAKAKLVAYLAPDGIAVVNADDPAWADLPNGHRRVRFSERGSADVWAEAIVASPAGSTFVLCTASGRWPVTLPLPGRFNVANALGVAGCAIALGAPPAEVARRLCGAPQVPGRMERIASRPFTILRDYSHKPDALERALETVRAFTLGRVIVVFGAGGDRDRGKRAPMGEIAVRLADVAIVTSDNPRTEDPERILDEVEAGMRAKPHHREPDRRRAIALALGLARAQDTILLAGKGHETYQIIGTEKQHFDEREIVRELGAT